jgi:PAS domain S-box-containing protein
MEIELRCIVDALPGLVWTARLDGHVDFLNQRWCEYTGLSVDEAYGRGWQTAIHPDDLPELLERWRSILASRESREMEARLRRFDGEYRWFLFHTNPLIDASGQVVKWCGMNTDIEDRRRSEETQRAHWWLSSSAREHHFRSVGDDIPGLATLMTPAGEVEIANRQVLEYFGATLKELKGWAIADTVHPDDLPDILAAWRGAVESAIRTTLRPASAVLMGSTAGSTRTASPCEIRTGASSFGTSCKPMSTTGSGVKLCSPVKSSCLKWWRAATRCLKYSKRSVDSSKAPPAGVTAASS